MPRPLRVSLLLAALLTCPTAGAQGAAASAAVGGFQVEGTITDSAGVPLAGAEVRVAGGNTAAIADRAGHYTLRDIASGSRRLMARRVGFSPQLADVTGEPGGRVLVDFVLDRAPQVLSGVEIVERPLVPERYRFTTRYDAFFQHRATAAAGVFLDHDELERRGGVTRALNTVAGVSAREFLGNLSVNFKRCGGGTEPAVLVNGILSSGGVLSTIAVSSIELVEVYRGIADMPAEARGNACGAIAIYTK